MRAAVGRDHANRLRELGERPDASRHLHQLERPVLGGLGRDRGRRAARRAAAVGRRMQVFLDRLRPEHGVLLRRLRRIELPHDRLVDPVRALEHPAGVVRIVPPAQVGMAVARPRRRTARLQDAHLVEIAGDLDRRLGALRGRCRPTLATLARSALSALARPALCEQRHKKEADNRRDDSSCPSHLGAPQKFSLSGVMPRSGICPTIRRMPSPSLMYSAAPRWPASLATFAGQARAFISLPMFAVKSWRLVPFRFRAFGVIISRCHDTALPAASGIFISRYACGFSHMTPVSMPFRSRHLLPSNSTLNPWWAEAPPAHPSRHHTAIDAPAMTLFTLFLPLRDNVTAPRLWPSARPVWQTAPRRFARSVAPG